MKIAIASDHGGYQLKEGLKQYLAEKGFDVVDVGIGDVQDAVLDRAAADAAGPASAEKDDEEKDYPETGVAAKVITAHIKLHSAAAPRLMIFCPALPKRSYRKRLFIR